MEVYVLNKSHFRIAVIDSFKSLIWTQRYYTAGDFELYMPADDSILPFIKQGFYLQREDDESIMVIERLRVKTDAENGDYFIISGRSLESIMIWRVLRQTFTLDSTGSLNDAVSAIVDECFAEGRQYPNFSVDTEHEIDKGNVNAQFTGYTMLDAITAICQPFGVGFCLRFDGVNTILYLYEGSEIDVIFSPEFDNIISSDYDYDYTNYANYAYVAGEGEGSSRKGVGVLYGSGMVPPTGLNLREIFIDARDISSNEGEISSEDYDKLLKQRGHEKLSNEYAITESFDAEIDPVMTFEYKKDYNLGDVVTVSNEYGVTSKPRIIEIIECWDEKGYTVIPTFDALEVV